MKQAQVYVTYKGLQALLEESQAECEALKRKVAALEATSTSTQKSEQPESVATETVVAPGGAK